MVAVRHVGKVERPIPAWQYRKKDRKIGVGRLMRALKENDPWEDSCPNYLIWLKLVCNVLRPSKVLLLYVIFEGEPLPI